MWGPPQRVRPDLGMARFPRLRDQACLTTSPCPAMSPLDAACLPAVRTCIFLIFYPPPPTLSTVSSGMKTVLDGEEQAQERNLNRVTAVTCERFGGTGNCEKGFGESCCASPPPSIPPYRPEAEGLMAGPGGGVGGRVPFLAPAS